MTPTPPPPSALPEVIQRDDVLEMEAFEGRDRMHRSMLLHKTEHFHDQPAIGRLYEDIFANLVLEASAIPGFGLAQEMLLERIAYIWASQKRLDNLDEPVSAAQYEKLLGRYTQLLNALFRSRSEKHAEEIFMRNFVGSVVRAVKHAIEQTIPDQPDLALSIQRRVVEVLRDEQERT